MAIPIRIAIFASGSGSNAENLIRFFDPDETIEIVHVFSNKKDAYVLERASRLRVKYSVFSRPDFNTRFFLPQLEHIDYIILAGFLWLIPKYLIRAFPEKIINIHPSLLPKYGGKGMYGQRVHEAVLAAEENESGITIHLVNDVYDTGRILFRKSCPVLPDDAPYTLAKRIRALEHRHFPGVVKEYIMMHASREKLA